MAPHAERFDLAAIRALPPSPGLSFRGRGSGTWQLDTPYIEPGWLLSSRDPRIGTDDFAHHDVVALFGACGRDLHDGSGRREEQETVFLPNSTFTVIRKGFIGTTWLQIVVVSRDDGLPERAPEVDVQIRRAVSAVKASLASPATRPTRSGRFSGAFGQLPGDAAASVGTARPSAGHRSRWSRRRGAPAAA